MSSVASRFRGPVSFRMTAAPSLAKRYLPHKPVMDVAEHICAATAAAYRFLLPPIPAFSTCPVPLARRTAFLQVKGRSVSLLGSTTATEAASQAEGGLKKRKKRPLSGIVAFPSTCSHDDRSAPFLFRLAGAPSLSEPRREASAQSELLWKRKRENVADEDLASGTRSRKRSPGSFLPSFHSCSLLTTFCCS